MAINLTKNLGSDFKAQSVRNPMIEVVLIIIVGGLFTWFMILPLRAELETKRGELKVAQDEEANIDGEVETLNELVSKMKSSKPEITQLDDALPLDGRVTRFHFLIEKLAEDVGVTVTNISVASPSTAPVAGDKSALEQPFKVSRQLQKLTGGISVSGSMDKLVIFLDSIERSGRLIDITDLSLESGADGDLNLRLTYVSYYYGK